MVSLTLLAASKLDAQGSVLRTKRVKSAKVRRRSSAAAEGGSAHPTSRILRPRLSNTHGGWDKVEAFLDLHFSETSCGERGKVVAELVEKVLPEEAVDLSVHVAVAQAQRVCLRCGAEQGQDDGEGQHGGGAHGGTNGADGWRSLPGEEEVV